MERNIRWTTWDGEGTEHLHLAVDNVVIAADGLIVGMQAGAVFSLHYHFQCDPDWHVRSLNLQAMHGSTRKDISLLADGNGHWLQSGASVPPLDGCLDVDISATPFTNTLPIRRLVLQPGTFAEILVVYISIPDLQIKPVPQRYTCLQQRSSGAGHYRYEGLTTGYTNELEVDEDGIVVDYPGLFRRVR